MKKISMKRAFIGLVSLLALSACGRLDLIPFSPLETPETWLRSQPFVNIRLGMQEIFLVQPSTSAIVYQLGILTIGVGLYFLKIRAKLQ